MAIPLFDDDHTYFIFTESLLNTFFGGSDSKEFACNAGDLVQSLSQEDPLEKRIATHSSLLAGECTGQRSQAGCSSWGSQESDMNEQLSTQGLCRRAWQPTPVFLPGESHRQRSLVGCSP